MAKYLFYPLDVPPFIEGSVKANKKEYLPFLFKWIHRELCDAQPRTGNNQMVETEEPPWVLKLCLPCSNGSKQTALLFWCQHGRLAFFFSPSTIFKICLKGCLFQTSGSLGFLPYHVNVILEGSRQKRGIDGEHPSPRNGSFTQGSGVSDGGLVWNFSVGNSLWRRFFSWLEVWLCPGSHFPTAFLRGCSHSPSPSLSQDPCPPKYPYCWQATVSCCKIVCFFEYAFVI